MKEIWKKIPSLPDHYEVSNKGRVRVLDRYIPYRIAGHFALRRGKMMSPFDDGRYMQVKILGRSYLVHRLVLTAFKGPPPFPDAECRHLDGKSKRNVPDNLEWGTATENQYDRFDHGTACKGEENYRAVLTEEDVRSIMALRGSAGPAAIARATGCKPGLVKSVIYGTAWNWLTGLPRLRYKTRKKGTKNGPQ